ncbi:MAG: multiheme c-type cytochrome [Calditrichaceae bacterium]
MKTVIVILLLIVLISGVSAQDIPPETNRDCAQCHSRIYDDWSRSMHALSTPEKDILYQKMMNWAVEDTKGKAAKLCGNCHMPFIEPSLAENPVDCIYCHSMATPAGRFSLSKTKYSAHDNDQSDYHKIEARDHFKNEQLCMRCHSKLVNANEVDICITGIEYESSGSDVKSCQSCHMPLVTGSKSDESTPDGMIRSHAFFGPHDENFLKGSLKLNLKYTDNRLTVIIDNSATPHAYPTGTPLRTVILKVAGYDAEDRIIFENWKNDPLTEDRQAVFNRVFEDSERHFPVMPWRASGVKIDTRIKAGEIREIVYQLPGITKKISAKLLFRLAPETILDHLRIDDPYLRKAHLINQSELMLN